MPAPKELLIVGRGAMGSMFAKLLKDRMTVSSWDRDPESGVESDPLETLAARAERVLLAVPASPHDELARRLAQSLPEHSLCFSIAKGLDSQGRTPAECMARHFGDNGPIDWGMICGPMIARDLSAGRDGFAVAAGSSHEAARTIQSLFRDTPLRLDADSDVHGACWAAILKNVYVPLIGAADALGLGDNLRGFLIMEALAELAGIVEAFGGRRETAYGPAGLGDLITTATSANSHHRGLGEALARGDRSGIAVKNGYVRSEGVHTAMVMDEQQRLDVSGFPLYRAATALLKGSGSPAEILPAYLGERFG
ncbi:hypothetical protein VCB98_13045 [Gammaproteobacteria bacterium AB-CW1]|uniref:Glycerol-3-phosphate dehydrogenase (NAD(P)(+)) n=1 Tax=Natronospira elongata TaxID=3110268 RepID=A0AAP6JHE2_9GAMM|nr:hypothetical protein [Gammaproteobacteria bacterium AB-CW1]